MKPVHGVPDPRGSLSASVPSRAIAEANKGVRARQAGKRGPYVKLNSSQRCEIAEVRWSIRRSRNSTAFFEEARETREREHCEKGVLNFRRVYFSSVGPSDEN